MYLIKISDKRLCLRTVWPYLLLRHALFKFSCNCVYQQFQENEKRRYEAEKKRAEQKHLRKLEELQAASEYTVKELEQLQNEKRKYSTSSLFFLFEL